MFCYTVSVVDGHWCFSCRAVKIGRKKISQTVPCYLFLKLSTVTSLSYLWEVCSAIHILPEHANPVGCGCDPLSCTCLYTPRLVRFQIYDVMLCIFAKLKYKSSLAVKLKSFHLSRLHGSGAKIFTHNGQSIVHHLNQRATVSGTASAHVYLTLRKQLWCHWCHIDRLMLLL